MFWSWRWCAQALILTTLHYLAEQVARTMSDGRRRSCRCSGAVMAPGRWATSKGQLASKVCDLLFVASLDQSSEFSVHIPPRRTLFADYPSRIPPFAFGP